MEILSSLTFLQFLVFSVVLALNMNVRVGIGFSFPLVSTHIIVALCHFGCVERAADDQVSKKLPEKAKPAAESSRSLTMNDDEWPLGWALLRAAGGGSCVRNRPLLTPCRTVENCKSQMTVVLLGCDVACYARLQRIYVVTAGTGPQCVVRPRVRN